MTAHSHATLVRSVITPYEVVGVGFSAFVGVGFPFFNSSSIALLTLAGVDVLAHLCFTNPSLPIKNFSKFHLIRCRPKMPGRDCFIHSYTGSAWGPFTSVLPSTGKVTP